jgi:LEA14-like dessication related protein
MKQAVFYSLLVLTGLSACDKPESPQFLYLENIVVELESLSSANLHAEAILHNPNKNTITIKSAQIDILMQDKVIAVLEKDFDIKAKGNTDFTIPLDVKIKLKDLNLNAIGTAFGLFGGKGQEIRYLGKIKVKAYGVPFSVKVDYIDNINIRI